MNVTPEIDERLYLREQIASGKIDGVTYTVTQNIDHQAFFVEFENDKTGKVTHVVFATPLREMVREAYEFYKAAAVKG